VEILGWYNPLSEPKSMTLKQDRVEHWLKVGAQPSLTVARLLKNQPVPTPAAV
jgi:small subunit ribosomal protein S16